MTKTTKQIIALLAGAIIGTLIVDQIRLFYTQQAIETAMKPLLKITTENAGFIKQSTPKPKLQPMNNSETKQTEKPKGCVIFKENCTCFDNLNNKIETTEFECKQFIKTNF